MKDVIPIVLIEPNKEIREVMFRDLKNAGFVIDTHYRLFMGPGEASQEFRPYYMKPSEHQMLLIGSAWTSPVKVPDFIRKSKEGNSALWVGHFSENTETTPEDFEFVVKRHGSFQGPLIRTFQAFLAGSLPYTPRCPVYKLACRTTPP